MLKYKYKDGDYMVILRIILAGIITCVAFGLFGLAFLKFITMCGDIIMQSLEEDDKKGDR